MIITSAPLRISFAGGGSDLPSFTKSNTGRVVSATINKRVYVTLNPSFSGNYRVSYSKLENVARINDIQHPLVRSCLEKVGWAGPGLEITSIADVPSNGTGLGSSSAFTVALLLGLNKLQNKAISQHQLAIQACEVEIEMANSPIGMQDQFASAFGGLNEFVFKKNGVCVNKFTGRRSQSERRITDSINRHILFFHLNNPRDANQILGRQSSLLTENGESLRLTHELANLATEAKRALIKQDFKELGRIVTTGWELKSALNGDLENAEIAEILNFARDSRVLGAKLLGAGGGGFLAILASPKNHDYVKLFMNDRYPIVGIRLESSGPYFIDTSGGNYVGKQLSS